MLSLTNRNLRIYICSPLDYIYSLGYNGINRVDKLLDISEMALHPTRNYKNRREDFFRQEKGYTMRETKVFSKNSTYQKFEVLKTNRNKRYRYNEFLVEGVRSLNEAVKNKWNIKSFIYDRNNLSGWAKEMIANVKTDENFCLTAELMNDLSNKDDTSELMAIIEMREDKLENVPLSENPFIVLFDRPSNKGNLGTMIRSCDALGADMLIITGHSIDLYDPDVVVSAMGSFFNMPVIRIADNNDLFMYLNKLKEQYPNFLTVPHTSKIRFIQLTLQFL